MVWWWMGRLSSGYSDVTDRPRSRQPCIAVSSQNEERLNQLIHANQWITMRKIYMELNVRFSALGTMLAMLEYHIVFAMWVPWMLTQECKDHLNASLSGPVGLPYHSHHIVRKRFPCNDAVITAVRKRVASAGADFYECSSSSSSLVKRHSWWL
jgi:hypothetical protein